MPYLKRVKAPPNPARVERETRKEGRSAVDTAFYHSREHRALRKEVFDEEPNCRICWNEHGRLRAAKVLDHIIPIQQGGAKLDKANVQPLCTPCHQRKSSLESHESRKRKP